MLKFLAPTHRRVGLLLAGSALALSACSGGGGGGGGAITVTATDYKFEPANVTVKAGQPVQLTLANKSTQIHDWVPQNAPGVTAKAEAQANQSVNITFTPSTAGTYKVICAQTGHEQLGMVGQLIVQ